MPMTMVCSNKRIYFCECDLCIEMFIILAEWVRHIESHAESTHCVPKKRKRIEVNQNNLNIVKYIAYIENNCFLFQ